MWWKEEPKGRRRTSLRYDRGTLPRHIENEYLKQLDNSLDIYVYVCVCIWTER